MYRALLLIVACLFICSTASAVNPIADAANKERRAVIAHARDAAYVFYGDIQHIEEKAKYPETYLNELNNTYANGTAFTVSPEGRLITAAHVIINSNFCSGNGEEYAAEGNMRETGKHETICAFTSMDGTHFYTAKLLFIDAKLDVAALQLQELHSPTPYLELEDDGETQPGDTVISVGDPIGMKNFIALGMVSNVNYVGQDSDYPSLRFSMPILPGNSGGPLINTGTSKAAGMINVLATIQIAKTSQNMRVHPGLRAPTSIVYAVPAAVIKKMLNDFDTGLIPPLGHAK